METTSWIIIAVIVIVLLAVAAFALRRRREAELAERREVATAYRENADRRDQEAEQARLAADELAGPPSAPA